VLQIILSQMDNVHLVVQEH